jgi:hypothetical protein
MKKLILYATVFAVFGSVFAARAGYLFGGMTLSTITTAQTNSPTFITNNAYVTIPALSVTNNALSITNAYIGVFRYSPDNGTTWFTNSSPVFTPTQTGATNYPINAQSFAIPLEFQMLAITNAANTSVINIGVTY